MRPYLSWYLLLPMALSLLYGLTQARAVAAMGASAGRVRANLIVSALSGLLFISSWSVLGYPLPLFYALVYLLRAVRLARRGPDRRMGAFVLNLCYVNTMSLHLAAIGAGALLTGSAMHALLADGLWRTVSTAVVLTASIAEDLVFLRRPMLPAILAAEAASVEARPFMAFLWFSTGYLLADSFLCVAELGPVYPPLFLLGSTAVLMYFVIRFLLHINALIREEYLRDEHQRLSHRLEEVQESAGMLRRLVDRDALTGAYSRRHIVERMTGLIRLGEPFALAFLDLDGLKQINDREGHDAGDRYLMGFAQAVELRLGEGELLARVGGDEFLALLPGCDAPEAARRIEGVRRALESRSRGGALYRFSYGVAASRPGDGGGAEALIREADRAMYRDKEQRR